MLLQLMLQLIMEKKKQFKITPKNMDVTQTFQWTLPIQQLSYSVSGFGFVSIGLIQTFGEQQQQKSMEPIPFQLSQEFTPMPWLSEIKAKTCMTYTPTTKDKQLFKGNFNHTTVVEVELPSGTRINERLIGFLLSRVEEVMYFTYEPCGHKLLFFINVPPTIYGKPVCFEWCLERLSTVIKWAPIEVRVYDYLQQETQLVQLIPFEMQPTLLGYPFVEAVLKAKPSLESMVNLQKSQQL